MVRARSYEPNGTVYHIRCWSPVTAVSGTSLEPGWYHFANTETLL